MLVCRRIQHPTPNILPPPLSDSQVFVIASNTREPTVSRLTTHNAVRSKWGIVLFDKGISDNTNIYLQCYLLFTLCSLPLLQLYFKGLLQVSPQAQNPAISSVIRRDLYQSFQINPNMIMSHIFITNNVLKITFYDTVVTHKAVCSLFGILHQCADFSYFFICTKISTYIINQEKFNFLIKLNSPFLQNFII